MKRTILLLLLLSAIIHSANAQNVKFDLIVNQVNSYMAYRGTNANLNNYRNNYAGLQAGIFMQKKFSPRFSVVTELYWAMKGSVLKEGNPLTTGKSSLRISTLELPLLGRAQFGQIYLNAGPYTSYLLAGRIRTEAFGNTSESKNSLVFGQSHFNRWEAGLQAGAGYDFKIKKAVLTLDFRYGYGLTSLSSDIERYNRTYTIGIRISKPKQH